MIDISSVSLLTLLSGEGSNENMFIYMFFFFLFSYSYLMEEGVYLLCSKQQYLCFLNIMDFPSDLAI